MATQKESISHTNKSKNHATKRVFDSLLRREDVATIRSLLQKGVDMEARDSTGRTLLLFASSRRRKEIVDLLIKAGANVNDKCYADQYTLLHYASRFGWTEIVRYLVGKVIDLDVVDGRGETAMHHATTSGHLKIVQCLLKNGAAMDQKSLLGFTPLMHAARLSEKLIFDLLLESGSNVDGDEIVLLYFASQNSWTDTVQFLLKRVHENNDRCVICERVLEDMTSSRGHLQVVKLLVEQGINTNNRGTEIIRQEALCHASDMGHLEVVKWLVKEGGEMEKQPDIDFRHKSEFSALYLASFEGHLEIVKWLVRSGANVNARNCNRFSSLQAASCRGHLEIVKWLVEEGSDIHARDGNGDSALHNASGEGYLEIVKYLVEQGADMNTRDDAGTTPLHAAATSGALEVVMWLVEKADIEGVHVVNARCKLGFTALHFASTWGRLEVVKYLVRWKAEINVKNNINETPLFVAAVKNFKDIVDFLLISGAHDRPHQNKSTVLHLAAARGWLDTVQYLIKKGCYLEAKNENGTTALQDACMTEELATVRVLLQAGARYDTADLNSVCINDETKYELFKLFIEHGAYIKPDDYDAILKNSKLRVLQDAKLCVQAIINKFNNRDLPELYKLPVSKQFPRIEKMKIKSDGEVAQLIERNVEFDIQANGHCNVLELRPNALKVLSVGSILTYYKRKTSKLKHILNLTL